jgi:hypothetical protein
MATACEIHRVCATLCIAQKVRLVDQVPPQCDVINVHARSDVGQPLLQRRIQHPFGVILRNVQHLNNAAIEDVSISMPPRKSRSRSDQAKGSEPFLELSSRN